MWTCGQTITGCYTERACTAKDAGVYLRYEEVGLGCVGRTEPCVPTTMFAIRSYECLSKNRGLLFY